MANFYYVKDDGTATGDAGRVATTRSTGTFAAKGLANYYPAIAAAFGATTSPVAGDFIFVSHLHAATGLGAQTWSGPATAQGVYIYSVSDTALDQYLEGGAESGTTANTDLTINGNIYVRGLTYNVTDDVIFGGGSSCIWRDGTINLTGSGDAIKLQTDNSSLRLINATINYGGVGSQIQVLAGNCFEMFGGACDTTSATDLINGTAVNGGCTLLFEGVDLSIMAGNIVGNMGGDYSNDDIINILFRNCNMHASATLVEETITDINHRVTFIGCGSTSAEAEYQFHVEAFGGVAEHDLQYRDESAAFPSGEKVSIKVTTNADATVEQPFWFELPARFAELSVAATDTIRLYLTSTTALDDTDVWAETLYPDGTNNHEFNYLTNQNADPLLASGTTHTDDSAGSAWKTAADADLTGHNEYRMDLDTSGNVGADGVPIVRIYVAVPSIEVFFDTELDLAA